MGGSVIPDRLFVFGWRAEDFVAALLADPNKPQVPPLRSG
jgi:hypothetical protein